MWICFWKGSFVTSIMLVVVLLLVVLMSQSVCKTHSMNCAFPKDPFPVLHEFYQLGDLVIGRISSDIFLFDPTPSFTEEPTWMLVDESM